MATSLRFSLFVCFSFVASFALGWICRPPATPVVSSSSVILAKEPGAENPRDTVARARLPIVSSDELANQGEIRVRAETASWYKKRGVSYSHQPFINTNFNMTLALILGLSPTEIEQLNVAAGKTKRGLDELAIANANAQTSADGGTLVVTVPSSPADSSRIYDALHETLKDVLGPERYQIFYDVAGEDFERSFDQFGLNPVRYELTLQPSVVLNQSVYNFKQSYLVAGTRASGTSGGYETIENLRQTYPVLAHFLPPDFGKPTGK